MAVHLSSCATRVAFHMQVSSAFSQMLNLHNLSEEISNAQTERAARMGEVILYLVPLSVKSAGLAVSMLF